MNLDSIDDVQRVAVVGAGEMGRGIASVAALAGYETTLQDIDREQLDAATEAVEWSYGKLVDRGEVDESESDAALARLATTESTEAAVNDADVVTEAVAERMDIKREVFEAVDEAAPDRTVITTNTSGLNVTELAETTDRPGQVAGMHWFNPPMLMELVEVVETEHTSAATADLCVALAEDFRKTPIRCRRDVPMFVVNRCIRQYGEAPAWLVHHDEATVEEIDAAMKYREDFPMGPFELVDFTGGIQLRVESEDDHLEDTRPLSYDTRYNPLFHELYEQGHYGRKTGKGFYDYSEADEPNIDPAAGEGFDVMQVWAPIINEAAKLVQHDVASVEDVDTGMRLGGNWPVGPLQKADEVGAETVVRTCVDLAGMHDRAENIAEVLPCDLLVEKATAGEPFH